MPTTKPFESVIAIPSYGRAGVLGGKKCTASYISPTYWPRTYYYVEKEEYSTYAEQFRRHDKRPNLVTTERADKAKTWGSIMDLIIDEMCAKFPHVIIMDDDLALAVRPNLPEDPTGFSHMTHSAFNQMVRELAAITTYANPLTSIQYRQFCQGKKSTHQHNQRISMVWSLNSAFFLKNPQFRFYRQSKLAFMTDYYFFLKLLLAGIPNVCINRYTKDDKPNAPGGERDKRKIEVFNTAAKQLEGMFPDYVRVYAKQGKSNWQDGYYGVTLYAAKAFAYGAEARDKARGVLKRYGSSPV